MKEGVIRFVEHSENNISLRTTTIISVPVNQSSISFPVWINKLEKTSDTNPV